MSNICQGLAIVCGVINDCNVHNSLVPSSATRDRDFGRKNVNIKLNVYGFHLLSLLSQFFVELW